MSSFFTVPGQKKRKRAAAAEAPATKRSMPSKTKSSVPKSAPKKTVTSDDENISGSDFDEEMAPRSPAGSDAEHSEADISSDEEAETAAERRLRLAERYLKNVKQEVDTIGFDAEEIDRDLIAARLQEDVAESKGKVYRYLVDAFNFDKASHTNWKANTLAFTSVAVYEPFAYTVTKDLHLQKWRIQDLPQHQFPQTTRRKPRKAPAPPRKKPTLVSWIKGDYRKSSKDKEYNRHTSTILCVAVSPDGKFVATGGADRKLIVYNAETLTPLKVFTHHRDSVTGLAFRRGTNQLFSCSKDRTVKVWSLNELAYVETLFGHQDDVVDVAALAQERCVTVGSRDRTARLWKVAEESQLVFRGGSGDKKGKKWGPVHTELDPENPRVPNEGTMNCVAMIDDELFVTGGDNGSLALWNVAKKKPLSVIPVAHGFEPRLTPQEASAELDPPPTAVPEPNPLYITALCTIPYSDLVLSGSWDGYIRVWRLSDDKRTLESAGVLGGLSLTDENAMIDENEQFVIKGIINDIDVFERGEKGKDGLCVVVAVGKEHRFGRWKTVQGGRNGGVVFEIPRGSRELKESQGESDKGLSPGLESE